MAKKNQNFNIVNPNPTDKTYCEELKATIKAGTMPKVLALLVAAHKGAPAPVENPVNTDLLTQNEALNQQVLELTQAITELQNKTPETVTVEVPVEVKAPAFIYDPGDELLKKMQRGFAYLHKKGEVKRDEPNPASYFTTRALNYYIRNGFTVDL